MTTKGTIKRNAVKELETILKSPFAVLKAINSNRDNTAIAELLKLYELDKVELTDLCTLYDYSERNIFCKLQKITSKNNIIYCEYKQIKIGNTFYQYIPAEFTVKDFFKSIESALKIKKEEAKTEKAYNDLFAKSDKKAIVSAEKKAANRAAKVAAKAKELKEKFTDLPDNMVMKLAEEFFKAA